MGIEVGLFGLVVLGLNIWALINIFQSSTSTLGKVLWLLGIFVFPILGFIAWLVFGPRKAG